MSEEIVLKKRSVFLMVIFNIITLLIYSLGWFLKNIEKFNNLLPDHPKKVSKGLTIFALICLITETIIRFAQPHLSGNVNEYSPMFYAYVSGRILSAIYVISLLALSFQAREILEKYFGNTKVSKVWTFFFTVFYLQFKINGFLEGKNNSPAQSA